MKHTRPITRGARLRISLLRFTVANIWLMLIFAVTAEAANPKLCFTQVTGLPKSDGQGGFTFPDNPPNLTILNDPNNHPVDPDLDTGWFNAFRLPFQNGTPAGDGVMQAIAQQNGQNQMLYFSFKVTNDLDADISDAVVLGFSSLPPENQNNQQTYTWVVIQPLALGAPGQPQQVPGNLIKVWKGHNQNGQVVWDSNFTTGPFDWITAVEASSGNGPLGWYVIVQIDNSKMDGPGLPVTGNFGILLDTVVTQAFTNMGNQDQQYIFPSALGPLSDTLNADAGVNPAPSNWADATFDANCSGVNFSFWDIANTVNGNPTSVISWTQTNNFSVKVHNSGAAAPQVRAAFKIANFGLPAPQEWALLGTFPNNDNVTPNPTNAVNIPAHGNPPGSCGDNSGDGCATINAPPWTLGAGNVAYYSQPANQHECVRVDLDSLSNTNPTFINNSSWNNFDFAATASKFVSPPAFVSGKYPPAKGAAPGAPQVIDLVVTVEKLKPGQKPGPAPIQAVGAAATRGPAGATTKGEGNRVVSAINFVVHACRHTGQFITIDPAKGSPGSPSPQKFENCEPIGAYGYGITHVGATAVTNWTYTLSGTGLTRLGTGVYRLNVPQDGVAKVVTTVEPEYPGEDKIAAYLDLGAAIPTGTPFSNAFNTGFSLNAGLEYMFTNRFSAEGIFGYHHFPAKIGSSLNVYQFSADAKAYLLTGTLRPFVNGGIGGYHLGSIGTDFGGNVGAGILKEFPNPHWGIQGSYNFHAVNTPVAATKFSTVQGGIRYVF